MFVTIDKKCCTNCKHFVQHYVLENLIRFKPLSCGHCVKDSKNKLQKGFPENYICDSWEPTERKVEDRIKSIKEIVKHMDVRLEQIEKYLEMITHSDD